MYFCILPINTRLQISSTFPVISLSSNTPQNIPAMLRRVWKQQSDYQARKEESIFVLFSMDYLWQVWQKETFPLVMTLQRTKLIITKQKVHYFGGKIARRKFCPKSCIEMLAVAVSIAYHVVVMIIEGLFWRTDNLWKLSSSFLSRHI